MSEDAAAVVAEIVAAASRLFVGTGYEAVSTEEIARSVGRSKKTLYKHFATKEALLHAVLARGDEQRRVMAGTRMTAAGDDRLERLRAAMLAIATDLASLHRGLLAELQAAQPALGRRCRSDRATAVAEILGPPLSEAALDGLLRQDVGVPQVLAVYLAAIDGMAADATAAEAFPAMVTLLVDGLRRR